MLQSVGHLESDLDQKLISSSPLMGDSCCEIGLKYLDQCLRYFGTIYIKIFTNSAILRISFIELTYKATKKNSLVSGQRPAALKP